MIVSGCSGDNDLPSAEALVGWLLEHQEVQVSDASDSDSLSSLDGFSDSDSYSDDMDEPAGAYQMVRTCLLILRIVDIMQVGCDMSYAILVRHVGCDMG